MDQILEFLRPASPHPSIKAEPLARLDLGGFHFVFTNSMLMGLLVMALLVLFFAWMTRRMAMVPGRGQNLAEAAVEGLLGLTEGAAGKTLGRRIFPLIATLFIFILAANYLALVPGVGSIGGCYSEAFVEGHTAGEGTTTTGEATTSGGTEAGGAAQASKPGEKSVCSNGQVFVPFLRAPNADLNMTLAMALIAVTIVQITGVVSHGVGGYIKELFTPVFLGPVHIVGELARVISLSCRLFGNIFGGEVLLLVMYSLLGSVLLGFGAVIFLGLEILFGGIQALLFSLLTLTYITLAASGHGPGGDHHAEAAVHQDGPVDHPQTGTEVHMA